jgi:hypothetical protein
MLAMLWDLGLEKYIKDANPPEAADNTQPGNPNKTPKKGFGWYCTG